MFGTSSVESLFGSFATDVSLLLTYLLGIVLAILAALLGLGFGISRVVRWIMGDHTRVTTIAPHMGSGHNNRDDLEEREEY